MHGGGKRITTEALEGVKLTTSSRHISLVWPNWTVISSSNKKAWTNALHHIFCLSKKKQLDRPLGEWIEPVSPQWQWFLEKKLKTAIQTDKNWVGKFYSLRKKQSTS